MRLPRSVRTPRAKVSELVRNCHVSSRIKKTLRFHEALIADIETKIQREHYKDVTFFILPSVPLLGCSPLHV